MQSINRIIAMRRLIGIARLRFLLMAIFVAGAAAQNPDSLSLKSDSVLRGYIFPFSCAQDQRVNFQTPGLVIQTPVLRDIISIQIGTVLLLSVGETAAPDQAAQQALRNYLHSDPASRGAAQAATSRFSLSQTIPWICEPMATEVAPVPLSTAKPAARRIFGGRIDVNGTASFGATIQRLISGSVMMFSAPTTLAPGAVTPTIYYGTSYGDSIKGSTTTKSSQIEEGGAMLEIRLKNEPGGLSTKATLNGDLFHSFSQGLALKQGYGGGIRQSLSRQFFVEGDLWYDHDTPYRPNRTFSSAAARIYEAYGSANAVNRVQFTESLESVLPFDSAKAMFFRGKATLSVGLGNSAPPMPSPPTHTAASPAPAGAPPFSIQISYSDDYFRDAPKGFKQNYGKLTLGITYTWSR